MKKTVSCLLIGSLIALSGVHGSTETEKLEKLGEALEFSDAPTETRMFRRYCSEENYLRASCHLIRSLLEVLFLTEAKSCLDADTTILALEVTNGEKIIKLAGGTLDQCCDTLKEIDRAFGWRWSRRPEGKAFEEMTRFVKKASEKFKNYKEQTYDEEFDLVKDAKAGKKLLRLISVTNGALLWSVQKIDEAFQQLQNGQQIDGETFQQEIHQILEENSIENL